MKKEKEIKKKIFEKVKEIEKLKKSQEKFIAGKTQISYGGRVYDEKEMINLVDASLDFWLTAGEYSEKFEKDFAKFLGLKYCLLTNSGSSANLLAISTLTSPELGKKRLKPGDEVITTACGFPTTLNPILQNNLVPVFIDVDLGTYNIRVDKIEKAISKKTKAIFIAHTLGNPVNLKKILKIVRKYNLWFIEDNCIDGNRCSIVKIDGYIQVLTIKEIYNVFQLGNYKSFEILSHGKIFKENDVNNLSEEFVNILSRRQLDIVEKYKKYHGNANKIVNSLGISKSSYYCSMWEIRKKMKEFIGVKYKWSKVKNVIFKGNKSVTRITQNFGQTSITNDHRLMIFKDNQLSDRYTEDFVRSQDSFVNILLTQNSRENSVDLVRYLKEYSQENGSIKYDNKWIWFKYNKKFWRGKLVELPKIKRYYRGPDLEKLCALFGLYCSEGSCGHELKISLTNYNIIKLIVKYIKSISNLKYVRVSVDADKRNDLVIRGKRFKRKKIVYSVNLGHELFNIIFSNLGGSDSYSKRVPNFIFDLDYKYIKVFYDYYIKGDGCRKSDDKADFVVTTASLKLVSGINLLNNLIFKKNSRFIITKGKYYDISPVKSLKYIKKRVNKIEDLEDVEIYDIVVEDTSTFVDACGNVLLHNCDALGSKYKGRYAGTFGDIATFSFYASHQIMMGEGGAVVTNNPLLKKIIASFRDWGRACWCEPGYDNTCGKRFGWQLGKLPFGYDHKYIYSHIGYNLKITDLQAAIGLAQLKKLPSFIKKRKENFDILYNFFKKYQNYFILPKTQKYSQPCWFGFPLLVKDSAPFRRNKIVEFLEENKIATRMLFGGNLTKQPAYQKAKYRLFGELKNTDLVMNNLFWIGVYPGINKKMLDYITKSFKEFLAKYE